MNRSTWLLLVAFVVAIVGLSQWTVPSTSAAISGGTLRMPVSAPAEGTLDPALVTSNDAAAIAMQIFDGLTQLDQNMTVQPAIASSWTISSDDRVYTFTLRNNVTFHNGRPVGANDFIFSWQRAMGMGGGYASELSNIASLTAPDNLTFVVTLTNTQSSFLESTTLPIFYVIPNEAASTIGTQPVGTGAFKYVSGSPTGTGISLAANPNYFGGRPYLDGVNYLFYSGPTPEWADFQGNKLDLAQVPTANWSSVQGNPDLITQSLMLVWAYGIDNTAFPVTTVRQALQQVIDRAGMVADTNVWPYTPPVQIAHGIVSPVKGTYNNSDITIPYNPTNALALLAAAGWTDADHDGILENGTTELTILMQDSSLSTLDQRMMTNLSNMGGTGVGARVTVTSTANAPGLNLRYVGWYSDYPDPQDDLFPYVSGGFFASKLNYNSAAFNGFYNSGQGTVGDNTNATRNGYFHSADYQVVITDATVIPLFYGAMVPVVTAPYVQGLQYSKLSGHPKALLKNVWLSARFLYLPVILR